MVEMSMDHHKILYFNTGQQLCVMSSILDKLKAQAQTHKHNNTKTRTL